MFKSAHPVLSIGAVLAAIGVLVACNAQKTDEEKTAQAIAPVAAVTLEQASSSAAPTGPRTGEGIVKTVCSACHETGVSGAPKMGDKAAWAPRIATGFDALLNSALKGKNLMPAKGGDTSLSDHELALAVTYMANLEGANFKEPAAPKEADK